MLQEIRSQRTDGERGRRWFQDEAMDLFFWPGEDARPGGFQLAYDKPYAEKLISWSVTGSFRHERVDDGARPGQHPGSPLLVADGVFPADRVRAEFLARAAGIDAVVRTHVADRLADFGATQTVVPRQVEPAAAAMPTPASPPGPLLVAATVLAAALIALAWQAFGGSS